MSGVEIGFTPWLPWSWLAAALLGVLGLVTFGLWRRARGAAWRGLAGLVILAALADPRLVREEGRILPDTVLVLVDRSASQAVGGRRQETDQALAVVKDRLGALKGVESRVVEAEGSPEGGTRLFEAAAAALADLPKGRLSAVILLTDGLVHDIPADLGRGLDAPVHVLLTGRPTERDRRVALDAGAYGMVGRQASLGFTVEDKGRTGEATVRFRLDGKPFATVSAPLNRPAVIEVPIAHPGPILVEVETEAAPDELTLSNNRAVTSVTGLRDRLKVLLVSGEPHGGVRAWRNLLKSDPGVDLVHFTILRPPEKDDPTPVKDLALIAFPVRELFEEKLGQFDLVILDRYRGRGLLSAAYSRNLADHVRTGGALLVSLGPEAAAPGGLASVPALADLLPALPTGRVVDDAFRPQPTEAGRRHPVTAGLAVPERWGPWLRRLDVEGRQGTALLKEAGGAPLLLVERVGEGRVALLLSDTVWAWARGFEGGGPHDALLRRLAHWLMKEPELEEESLRAEMVGDELLVTRHAMVGGDAEVRVTDPEGNVSPLRLIAQADGAQVGRRSATRPGLWRVEDGAGAVALAARNDAQDRELSELAASDRALSPVARATGGTVLWLSKDGVPALRRVKGGGPGWIGLPERAERAVERLSHLPLLPSWAFLVLALGALLAGWRRESRG